MWLVEWINQNSQAITTFLTSANFIALVTMIVKVIFGAKQTKLLKNNVENLTSDLMLVANTRDEIAHNSKSNANLVERVSSLEAALLSNNKAIEAMLSIMGIVYMRSKDEDVRSSVASILSTFKNGDITIRNLKLELEHVKEQLSEALAKVDAVSETKEEQIQEVDTANTNHEAQTKVQTEVLLRG